MAPRAHADSDRTPNALHVGDGPALLDPSAVRHRNAGRHGNPDTDTDTDPDPDTEFFRNALRAPTTGTSLIDLANSECTNASRNDEAIL